MIGQVAVTQALLPALRAARGRIVMISSIGGRVALPLAGPYAGSKFALEAISDSLRREVAAHGVQVVVVEPGGIKTAIWDRGARRGEDRMQASAPPETEKLYGGRSMPSDARAGDARSAPRPGCRRRPPPT